MRIRSNIKNLSQKDEFGTNEDNETASQYEDNGINSIISPVKTIRGRKNDK